MGKVYSAFESRARPATIRRYDSRMTDHVLEQAVKGWARTAPAKTTELSSDKASFGHFWTRSADLLARLPAKPKRNAEEAAAAAEVLALARESRTKFMRAHARGVYDSLTAAGNRFVRVDDLCSRAAAEYPGLVPNEKDLARESGIAQGEKDGLEVDQGIFLSQVLADQRSGTHLCHAMLLPREDSQELLADFARTGKISFDGARLERQGKASVLTMSNPRFLNAEDEGTLAGLERAIDLALLDPQTEICVLRGDTVTHTKYAGRRLFGAGINLTHLYQGKIRLLWYLIRDLGLVNKLYRGLARPESMDAEIARLVAHVTGSGMVSAAGNRRALRIAEEPLDAFRRYMAVYAREQAHCHFSPALIANLEKHWDAANRKG